VTGMTRPIPHASCSSDDHEGFCSRMLTKLNSLWVRLTYPFASCGRNFSLHYASEISRTLATRIQLGSGIWIGRHTWFHLGMEGEHAIKIAIGQDCRIGPRCTISAKNSIHLGQNVVLGSDVLLMDHNHAYEDVTTAIWRQGPTPGGRIKIGEGCRIGRGAAILCDKGDLVLGQNCEVSPGAVVTRSFPADSVISGNPARAARKPGTVAATGVASGRSSEASEASEAQHGAEIYALDSQEPGENSLDKNSNRYLEEPTIDEDLLSWISRLAGKIHIIWLARTFPFYSFGNGAWAHYSFAINRAAAPYIRIGKHVGFGRDAKLEVQAGSEAVPPVITMDDRSGLQRRCVISARNHIHVMRDVIFGPSVLVTDHGGELLEGRPAIQSGHMAGGTIRIEEECWIGFGSVIACEQGELTIGRHSVVGANSLITRSIPPYSVVAGNPARIVKQYDFFRGKWVLGCIRPAADAEQPNPAHVAATPT
jgi:acetyltransferase-like isoleucine patch superfamily enzyme